MKIATVRLQSISAYTQSQKIASPKKDKEGADAYEERTWRERMHANESGNVYIPAMAFKFSLATAAKFLRIRIPGKDKSEYTKHFNSGVLVLDDLVLPIKADDVQPLQLFLNSNGKRGGGTRVLRYMPTIAKWSGELEFYVLDDTITKEIFERVLKEAGNFIGIGQFRPENGGFNGRFSVVSVKWREQE
jgi:hypothetical protein